MTKRSNIYTGPALVERGGPLNLDLYRDYKLKEITNDNEPRTTLFSRQIQEQIEADNNFTNYLTLDNALSVAGGSNVIPQSANDPEVITGAPQPATLSNNAKANFVEAIVRRNSKKEYKIEYFSTKPYVNDQFIQREVSYDRDQELLKAHARAYNTARCNYAIDKIALDNAQKANIVPTSGANRLSSIDNTTKIKKITFEDIKQVLAKFKKQGLSGYQIYALITADQWTDLMGIPEIVNYNINSRSGQNNVLSDGELGNFMGIKFLDARVNTEWGGISLAYDVSVKGTYTKKSYKAVLDGTTDTEAALFWVKEFCWKAEAPIKLFTSMNNPNYYGDVYSMQTGFGATRSREDNKGVVVLSETLGA